MNTTNQLPQLLALCRRARKISRQPELAFLLVNESHALATYRQAALWFAEGGIRALSGVVEPEANAPYTLWLTRLCQHLAEHCPVATPITAIELPGALAEEWGEWLPPRGLWLPFPGGALLLAGESAWDPSRIGLLEEWVDAWQHAWQARTRPTAWSWQKIRGRVMTALAPQPERPWWKQNRVRIAAAVLAFLLFPVRLTVLAPGELVPANPAVIRAPVDGVVGQFQVQPNEQVKTGQVLFNFDEAAIATRQEVASQALAAAQAEYRQSAQQALADSKAKAQLAGLLGKIEEKRAEAAFSSHQLARSRVTSPRDGIALFDDPSEWEGRPVQTGERIMRIAAPGDVEVEAWLPLGDAIPLPDQADLRLYLAASPLSSLPAQVRYVAHDAVARPDGSYAYRVRARLEGSTDQRVGLKGTARISGNRVPLIYWVLRRPLATIRQALGI